MPRFNPDSPPHVGDQVRVAAGQFDGHFGQVTRIDCNGRAVYFTIAVFERPVELSLDFDTAVEMLEIPPATHS